MPRLPLVLILGPCEASTATNPAERVVFRPELAFGHALVAIDHASLAPARPADSGPEWILAAARTAVSHPLTSRTRIGVLAIGAAAGSLGEVWPEVLEILNPQAVCLVAPEGQPPEDGFTPSPGLIATPRTPLAWMEATTASIEILHEAGADGAWHRPESPVPGAVHPGILDRARTHLAAALRPAWEGGSRALGIAIGQSRED